MTKISKKSTADLKAGDFKRRSFLKYTGLGIAGTAVVMAGCEDDTFLSPAKNNDASGRAAEDGSINLGSGDIGILNYAYALEQLEAAFYTMVVAHENFDGMYTEEEKHILMDLMNHEIVHREYLKTALGENAIPTLTPDFSAVDFSSKESVLATAKVFEDLGVAAYNGAGKLINDVNILLVAGKIVSVEARHAAAIRDVINPLSMDFAGSDVVNEQGLDRALMPMEVLPMAQPFITEIIDGSDLPTE